MTGKLRKRISAHLRFRRRTAPGAAPGTVTVDPEAVPTTIRVITYGPDDYSEVHVDDPTEVARRLGAGTVTWVDVQGLGDADTIHALGQVFGLHPLALEDVTNVHQRSKLEDYEEHLFVVMRMLSDGTPSRTEQISLFLGQNYVVTFQERPGDCLDPVRERIRKAKGRIRKAGADYLAYALLDAVVDGYFPHLDRHVQTLDRLDEDVSALKDHGTLAHVHDLRSELLFLRRAIWPMHETLTALSREVHPLVREETRVFLRDCHDHTWQLIDLVDTCREMCSDLREFYLSTVNNRMSEVMKVLTIIATVFIPLGFLAGLWGMNFNPHVSPWNMPELELPYGYPLALGLMAAVAGSLLLFFWRRGWFRT